jgi:hypothetical protein
MTTLDHVRLRLDAIASAATTGSDALDGANLDLGDGTLADLLSELENIDARLAVVLDRLAGALDPVQDH